MVLLKRKLYFSNNPEGVQHLPGEGGGGGGGGPNANFYRTHITCDFPGGVGVPIPYPPPPLWKSISPRNILK